MTFERSHDTVEDTNVTMEDLRREFGEEVAALVAEVTDDKSLAKHERKRAQISHAAHASCKAKLVKLADKLCNLRDLLTEAPTGWTQERVRAYFGWSSEVIAGLRGTNTGLEHALDAALAGELVVGGAKVRALDPEYTIGDWEKSTPTS
jgi:hypothetical protein